MKTPAEIATPAPPPVEGAAPPVEGAAPPKEPTATPPADVVPEKYDFKLPDAILAEGFELDPKVVERATPIFKELGLTQPQAQRLVDLFATESQAANMASMNAARQQNEDWHAQVKADPEIGGKLDQVKTAMAKALDGLGDPALAKDFRAAMDLTGAGNHPAIVKALYKLASRVNEGTAVNGRGPVEIKSPTGRPASAASAMYPHLPQG